MRVFFAMLLFASFGQAQERLIVKEGAIYTICSFDSVDYFSALDPEGEFLWEISFGSKIISVEEDGGRVLILSRIRDGSAYYLSCIEKTTGAAVWEKGVFAPREVQAKIEEIFDERE